MVLMQHFVYFKELPGPDLAKLPAMLDFLTSSHPPEIS
jgi:hypothetical protein